MVTGDGYNGEKKRLQNYCCYICLFIKENI